ncbi:MAG: DUF1178 family protein [Gammaproteobacteria bacterium]|nr:DUF1178 family protein [Gammaproteobacteria bacterium]
MVVYDLHCAAGHTFEGWFRDPQEFERQLARHLVACPACDSIEVRRRPSANAVIRNPSPSAEGGRASRDPGSTPSPREMARAVRCFVERHFEDVGARFAVEARRMHRGEAEERNIRGIATPAEVRELHDEGVAAMPLPGAEDDKPN